MIDITWFTVFYPVLPTTNFNSLCSCFVISKHSFFLCYFLCWCWMVFLFLNFYEYIFCFSFFRYIFFSFFFLSILMILGRGTVLLFISFSLQDVWIFRFHFYLSIPKLNLFRWFLFNFRRTATCVYFLRFPFLILIFSIFEIFFFSFH